MAESTALSDNPLCWTSSTDLISSPEAMGYFMGCTIGTGSYAKVKAAWSPALKKEVAIKIINKQCSKERLLLKFITREVSILSKLHHPHILQTYQVIQTAECCYIVMELAHNGDLLDHINYNKKLSEGESKFFFQQICEAVLFCHQSNIVHRDLKCENVMLDKNYDAKLGDFGFALDLNEDISSTPCGSKRYSAPELHLFDEDKESIDAKKTDVWSLGVILYIMVTGHLPFLGKTTLQSLRNKLQPLKYPGHLSSSVVDFLCCIFTTNPTKRPAVEYLLTSAWTISSPVICPSQTSHSNTKYTIDTCFSKSTARNITTLS